MKEVNKVITFFKMGYKNNMAFGRPFPSKSILHKS